MDKKVFAAAMEALVSKIAKNLAGDAEVTKANEHLARGLLSLAIARNEATILAGCEIAVVKS